MTTLASKRLSKTQLFVFFFLLSLSVRLLGIYLEGVLHLGGHVAWRYTDISRNIVSGNGFSDAPGVANTFEPPIYPYLLSALFALFGENLTIVKLSQAILDSVTTCVLFLVTRTALTASTACLAAIFYALYPVAVYSVADVAPETTFTLLLSCAVLTLALAFRTGRLTYHVLSGLLLGAATLTRATTLYFIPFLLLFLVIMRAGIKPVMRVGVVTLPAFLLIIAPWTARNYVVSKRFIPVAVMGYGEVFLQGSSEEFLTIQGKQQNYPAYFQRLRAKGLAPPLRPTPKEWNDYALKAGWERYKEKWHEGGPLSMVTFFAYKFARLWYSTESGTNQSLILLVNAPILVLAGFGLVLAVRSRIPVTTQWPLWAIVLFFIAVHIVSLPLHRYMSPVTPYLLAYAVYCVASLPGLRSLRLPLTSPRRPPSSGSARGAFRP